jgi:Zn-dependent metalloprotease
MRSTRLLRLSLSTLVLAGLAACAVDADHGGQDDAVAASESNATSVAAGPRASERTPSLSPAAQAAAGRARAELASRQGLVFADDRHELVVRDAIVDPNGTEHVRFSRNFLGMRVIGGDFVLHTSRGAETVTVTQTLSQPIDVRPTDASLHPDQAQSAAIATIQDVAEPSVEVPALVVLAAPSARPELAYEVIVTGIRNDGKPTEAHVIVSALDGRVLSSWDGVLTAAATGTGKSLLLGQVPLTTQTLETGGYELTDPSRGGSKTVNLAGVPVFMNFVFGWPKKFTDTDNTWGTGLFADPATVAVDAQYGSAVTWDYFANVHARIGIRNDGVGATSRVHFGRNFVNAFWSDQCFCMTYGDGDANFNPLVALDVSAHEMSHGVTSATAGLVYSGESGGLNEATSDIFAAMVEYYANNAADAPDYTIGEKVFKAPGKAMRYMSRPSLDSFKDADGTTFVSHDCYTNTIGSVDVHYSSGVANHFFYLLAEGSADSVTCSGTDGAVASGGPAVTGIGRSAAERIWYRALTVYMTSQTNYAGARIATISAAKDLFGPTSPQALAVANAWTAVQVN